MSTSLGCSLEHHVRYPWRGGRAGAGRVEIWEKEDSKRAIPFGGIYTKVCILLYVYAYIYMYMIYDVYIIDNYIYIYKHQCFWGL